MLGLRKDEGGAKAAKSREVRAWAREALGLGDDVTVMVTELTCSEPGCPAVETVIAVLRGKDDNRQTKIARPMVELTKDDVARALTGDAR